MNLLASFLRPFLGFSLLLCLAGVAQAQRGLKGQIYLPNGAPIQKVTRFELVTSTGSRNEIHFTDSNGRIAILSPPIGQYSITVNSDGETFETTTVIFHSQNAGNHINVHLNPLQPRSSVAPGKVDASDIDRDVSPKAKGFYDQALEFIRAQQYDLAIAPLRQAIQVDKKYFQAHNDLGVVYMKLQRYAEAEAEFNQAIRISEAAPQPFLNLGLVLNRQKKHKEAVDILVKAKRRHPELDSIHSPLIEALFGAQMWREAEEAVKTAMGVEGFDAVDLQVKLGTAYLRQGKYADAVTVLRQTVSDAPNHAMAQFELGAALMQTGNLDEAETALLRAYEIRGVQMPGVQMLLGQLYYQKKKYDKAIEAFELYLRLLPNAPNAAQVKEAIARLRQSTSKQ